MANYSFTLRNQYKPGTIEIQKEIRKIIDAKKKNRKIESILSANQVPVRLTVGIDRKHRFHCKTGLHVYPKQWDFEKQRIKWQASGSQEFNKRLNGLLEDIQEYYTELIKQETKPSFEQVRELIQKFVATNIKPRLTDNELSFFEVYNEFLKRKENKLHKRTIQKFNTSKKLLETFTQKYYRRFAFESIDVNFIDKYKSFLSFEAYNQKIKSKDKNKKKGFRDDTTAKYIENLKNFLRWSYERNFHKNTIFQHSQFRVKRDKDLNIITMTIHELKHFYEFGLSQFPSLERVRDVYCFGAFTGQRWSDVSAFKKDDLQNDTWIFEAYKTKKKIIIPFVGFASPALDILKKYNYELPSISNQKFNDYLKEAASKAELNRTVEINRYQGNKKISYSKPLHEVISSHLARRTTVSILLNIYQIPINQVMEITGHSDFKTLKRYIDKDREALRANLEKTKSVIEIMKLVKPA